METTFNYLGKTVTVVHTADESKFSFDLNGNTLEVEVIGASNNKKAKQIRVDVVRNLKDVTGTILRSERDDYLISDINEYTMFYNIPTVANEGLGFTEYMHALNGALARCPELNGTPDGQGVRLFNADGTLRDIQEPAPVPENNEEPVP